MSIQFQVKTNNVGAMKKVLSQLSLKTGKLRNTGELNLRQSELERLKLLLNKKEENMNSESLKNIDLFKNN